MTTVMKVQSSHVTPSTDGVSAPGVCRDQQKAKQHYPLHRYHVASKSMRSRNEDPHDNQLSCCDECAVSGDHPSTISSSSSVLTNNNNSSSSSSSMYEHYHDQDHDEEWRCSACDYRNVDARNPICSVCGASDATTKEKRGIMRMLNRKTNNKEEENHKRMPQLQQPQQKQVNTRAQEPRSKSTSCLMEDPYYNMLDTSILKPTCNYFDNLKSKSVPCLFNYTSELQDFLAQVCSLDSEEQKGVDREDIGVSDTANVTKEEEEEEEKEYKQTYPSSTTRHCLTQHANNNSDNDNNDYCNDVNDNFWICQVCTFRNEQHDDSTYHHEQQQGHYYLACFMCGEEKQEFQKNTHTNGDCADYNEVLESIEKEYYEDLIYLQQERLNDFQNNNNISCSLPSY
mmetsp:Transcript_9978/g.14099  ORF Transcript_9978/g.14099 Transcript_9978/m.14099 type:complete len:398 (+) Transcript_9978:119-1312(+)